MDKATVVKQNMVQHTNLEVEILTTMTAAGHPFFVHLYDAFQTSQKLILAMEVRSITKSSIALAHLLIRCSLFFTAVSRRRLVVRVPCQSRSAVLREDRELLLRSDRLGLASAAQKRLRVS